MSSYARGFVIVRIAAVAFSLIALGCMSKGSRPVANEMPDTLAAAPPPTTAVNCSANGATPNLNCAALPNTNAAGRWVDSNGNPLSPQPANGQAAANAYLDYDLWAWNSFIAMNWPALDPATNNNQRGFPDLTKSFAGAQPADTAVWETYKEKREVFLYNYQTRKPSSEVPPSWNSPPQYGPSDAPVPCCPGADCTTVNTGREIGSPSKLFLDTLDETAEVASEALETQAALCAGWVANPAAQCATSNNPCCTLNGHPVGPRVWRGNPYPTLAAATPVVYEVKINYDSFNYIVNTNQYYLVGNARAAAYAGKIRLPARTSATKMPPAANSSGKGGAGPNAGPVNYSASTCLGDKTGTPCLAGAVHLKAAWLPLGPNDNPADYHTADAFQYYSNPRIQPGGLCKAPSLLGLVGLHIIQRVHQTGRDKGLPNQGGGSSTGQPQGGTYVFASWEHINNDSAGFTYANYSGYTPAGTPNAPLLPYPNVGATAALPLNRVYPILPSTARATALIHSLLPAGSVWRNYGLIGTQYAATQTPSPIPAQLNVLTPQPANIEAPANSGQPYYLANLVVESNVGLQQFQGLPPTSDPAVINVIPHYTQNNVTSQFGSAFQRSAENLASRTMKDSSHQFVMGGCMGCHGVAQLSGYSFSFVLLDNQFGASPDSQNDFAIPPTPDQPPD